MFKIKNVVLLIIALALVLAIASCGAPEKCNPCVDSDGDGFCDVCKKEIPEEVADVPLFEDGEPTFQIVLAKNAGSPVRQAINSKLKAPVKDAYEVSIDSFTEGSENDEEIDVEILVGNVTSRGDEYFFDGRTLGKEGYVIKIVGSKIILNAGSDETLAALIENFAEFLVDRDDYYDVVMTKEDTVLEIQDDYNIDSLKVNGTDMKGYTIATDLTKKYYKNAALELQDIVYEKTGYWFEIADIEKATDKSIIMKHVDGITGDGSFKISAMGKQLLIECAFDNYLEKSTVQFAMQKIAVARGDVDFRNTVYTQDISVVYYDDFGAVGDGRTDDFLAIYNAHVFANECGQTVKASRNPEGKVYYIYDTRLNKESNRSVASIPIMTNTDWQGTKFVIDDLKIPTFTLNTVAVGEENLTDEDKAEHDKHYRMGKAHIFTVIPEKEHEVFKFSNKTVLDKIVADGLRPGTKHVDLKIEGWDGDLMIVPYNSQHGVFRRLGAYGSLQSKGADMHELIVIDEDGNVSEETPIMFEYTNIDYILVYKLDPSTAITVGNATIETLEARVQNKRFDKDGNNLFSTGYVCRGISVTRSYTVVENVKHEVVYGYTLKERASGLESSNYTGMFRAANANCVTFRNCEMHGRQKYDGHSSYDFGAGCVNKIVLENCIQTNFWIKVDPYEGIMQDLVDYEPGAYTSMSTVQVYDNDGVLKDVGMCWGIGGTNYCKNMEYISSQLSRFDAHQGLYNGKVIDSKVNYLALTGYGDMIIEGTTWYQPAATNTMLSLRGDYGYLWNGTISVKDTKAYVFDINEKVSSFNIVGHNFTNFYFGYPTSFPSVSIDNLDVYSLKNQAPVDPGFTIKLVAIKSDATKMHLLGNCGKKAIFTYVDKNGDGYIDEPLFDNNYDGIIDDKDRAADLDGFNGPGETNLSYEKHHNPDIKVLNKGIPHPNCMRNLNPVKPPEFIKIVNNDGVDGTGGYVYQIINTGGQNISDGGWYRDKSVPDTMGGFFGGTKFIYGEGENEYFIGSNHPSQTETKTFEFIN